MGDLLSPPATNVPIVRERANPGKIFDISPTWLRWFIDLVQFVNASGGTDGAASQSDFQAHLDDDEDAHDAEAISFVPVPGITAVEVQTAIEQVLAAIVAGGISGTYTPTLTGVANVAASTPYECQYLRVGNTVNVSGKVAVDVTAGAVATQLGISLPIASNFGAEEDCAGVAFAPAIQQGASILADAANNRAQLEFLASDLANRVMAFTFSYQVI